MILLEIYEFLFLALFIPRKNAKNNEKKYSKRLRGGCTRRPCVLTLRLCVNF